MADSHTLRGALATKAQQGRGPVAQWTTRLPTEQKILGSTPSWLVDASYGKAMTRHSLILSFLSPQVLSHALRKAKDSFKISLHMTDDRMEFYARRRVIRIGACPQLPM